MQERSVITKMKTYIYPENLRANVNTSVRINMMSFSNTVSMGAKAVNMIKAKA